MDIEKWVSIDGYESTYEVSDQGRIRKIICLNPFIFKILNGTINKGYRQVGLTNKAGERRTVLWHRIVAIAFIGPYPDDKEINHKDGIKLNNHPNNLEYISSSENKLHAQKLGLRRSRVGEGNSGAKLSKESVLEIRKLYTSNISIPQLAKQFNLAKASIHRIVKNISWRNVDLVPSDFKQPHYKTTITHCPHGHEYTVENTYYHPITNYRDCLICRRRRSQYHKKYD